ncbi:YIP1 family protein [Pseudomonas dryadis]|uniref:YIP1 family protein n=1 Tax=Phytopseudomonas dryadis TaxID=2487520 RepID=A0A4V2KCW1_9GAMM|nr:YIP1 family protein [Pseudomonas dryadis]TBV00910.1 YIP1 family protein [Pseudomonas dryadis]TBV13602.1 YIP1 family protein [Pseudomonas sp. FRB 230]
MNHIWGLLAHPGREWRNIDSEKESITHLYAHHVLLMALIPVVSAFIGTTQIGWHLGGEVTKVAMPTGAVLGITFYILMLLGVAIMGNVIHWMSDSFASRPSRRRCIVFAGYVATPLFIAGLSLLYPKAWLLVAVGIIALAYSGYLLYVGMPAFLRIPVNEALTISGGTLAIGVLLLELILALTVALWGLGFDDYAVSWSLFR